MRFPSRFALLAPVVALAALAAAADPLLKPVVPPNGSTRVRVPVTEDANTFMQFKARIPKPKGKKGETIDVTVAIETLPHTSVVTLKRWKEWGFEVPPTRTGVIPELVIPAAQLSPKPPKGPDIEVRIPAVPVEIVEPAAGADPTLGCDLYLCLRDLTKGSDRAFEPRVHFAGRFLELTVPNPAVARLNAGPAAPPDPGVNADPALVPAAGPQATPTGRFPPTFAFASVNGVTQYKTPDGRTETVSVGVSSTTNYPAPGILMTLNTARGCGVELGKAKPGEDVVKGTARELRLGVQTGPGFKDKKDFVLRDVTVYVTDDKTAAFVWLGPRFVEEYFKDGVYGGGPDGWRLLGRVKAEYLEDIKTRVPAKKP